MPINEDHHWYLAIVVNPAAILQERPHSAAHRDPWKYFQRRRSNRHASIEDMSSHANDTPPHTDARSAAAADNTHGAATAEDVRGATAMHDSSDVAMRDYPDSERQGRSPTRIRPGESRSAASPAGSSDHIDNESGGPAAHDAAYVLVFDSLGLSHARVRTALRDYLRLEAKDKQKVPQDFDPKQLSEPLHVDVHVPTQSNSCDCGIYLLHFFERFFSNPASFVDIAVTSRQTRGASAAVHEMWQEDDVTLKRSWWKHLIWELSADYKERHDTGGSAPDSDIEEG